MGNLVGIRPQLFTATWYLGRSSALWQFGSLTVWQFTGNEKLVTSVFHLKGYLSLFNLVAYSWIANYSNYSNQLQESEQFQYAALFLHSLTSLSMAIAYPFLHTMPINIRRPVGCRFNPYPNRRSPYCRERKEGIGEKQRQNNPIDTAIPESFRGLRNLGLISHYIALGLRLRASLS